MVLICLGVTLSGSLAKYRGGKMVLLQNVTDTSGTNLTCAGTSQKGHGAFISNELSSAETKPHCLF